MCVCVCVCVCVCLYICVSVSVSVSVSEYLYQIGHSSELNSWSILGDGATVYLHMDDGQVMYCVPPYGAICVYLHVYRHVVLVCTAYGATVCASMCTSICTSIWCYCVNLNLVLLCTCIWMMVR